MPLLHTTENKRDQRKLRLLPSNSWPRLLLIINGRLGTSPCSSRLATAVSYKIDTGFLMGDTSMTKPNDGRFHSDSIALLHGPYRASQPRRNGRLRGACRGVLHCWRNGPVLVSGYTNARISWPLGRPEGAALKSTMVLCGDLVRALRCESNLAVQHWWGVSHATVSKWRKALNVPQFNEGTRILRKSVALRVRPATAVGRAYGNTIAARAKAAKTLRATGRYGNPPRRWSDREVALFGTMSDATLAKRLRCNSRTLGIKRRQLGMAAYDSARWRKRRKTLFPLARTKLLARRLALNLTQAQLSRRMGWGQNYYTYLEQGKVSMVTLRTLNHLIRGLQCRPEDITRKVPSAAYIARLRFRAAPISRRLPEPIAAYGRSLIEVA
jgi:transcriptional regulator with XRE-family HTH domain